MHNVVCSVSGGLGWVFVEWGLRGVKVNPEFSFVTPVGRMMPDIVLRNGGDYVVEMKDESFAVVEIEGKRGLTPLLVSKDLKDLLIGVLTLEALGLTVDPTTGKLKETRILLL